MPVNLFEPLRAVLADCSNCRENPTSLRHNVARSLVSKLYTQAIRGYEYSVAKCILPVSWQYSYHITIIKTHLLVFEDDLEDKFVKSNLTV